MRQFFAAILLTTLCFGAAHGEQPLAITDVNVIPMDEERVIEGQTVVIELGNITAIGPDAAIPDGAQVIDGAGKYLMPGLAEMHAHVPGGGFDDQAREDVMFLYLANGITLARNMAGHRSHLELRSQIAHGNVLGPRLYTAGPGFSGGNVETAGDGIHLVRQQAEAGYDFLKIFWGISLDNFEVLAEEAHRANITFSGHVPEEVGVPRALELGYTAIDHFDAYMHAMVDPQVLEETDPGFFGYKLAPYVEEERMRAIAEATRDAGVWNVPTETIMYSATQVDLETVADERPEFQYMPADVVNGWFDWVENFRAADDYDQEAADAFIELRLDLIRTLHEVGAGLALGSDAPQWFNVPGFSVHREMAVMEEAGLTPYEVLETGTVNPAKYLGEEDVFGRVAEGLKAELVLLDANPLEDLANAQEIAGVVRHGRWVSRADIDARLADIAGRYAAGHEGS